MNSKGITGQKPFFQYEKGSNSVKNGRILPINNPIPLIADNNMYAKFEKSPWINTQVIDRKWWAQTDGRTDTEGYNIIPRHTLVAGYKNQRAITLKQNKQQSLT